MGYLEIACAGVIWACTGPMLRQVQKEGFTSWDIVLARAVMSACFLGLYLIVSSSVRRRRNRRRRPPEAGSSLDMVEVAGGGPGTLILDPQDLLSLAMLGFLAVMGSQSTFFYALAHTSVAVAVTLNYTSPFFVMALSFLLYKEPVTRGKVLALAGAMTGVALVSGFIGPESARLGQSIPGIMAGLFSGFGYGFQTIVYKRVGRKYGPISLNFWTMAFGSVHLSAVLTLVSRRPPEVFTKMIHAPLNTWILLLLIGLGPGTIAFLLFTHGINKVDATKGSIVAMSEPVAASLLGYFLLGERLTITQAAGIILVLSSIWAVSVPDARRRKAATEQA